MALIKAMAPKSSDRTSVHGEVEATFHMFEKDGVTYLQIDTYGAPGREIVGKTSQSVQFGPEGRAALMALLEQLK